MDRRLQPVRRRAFALLGLGLLLCTPWVGPWTLIPLIVAAALYAVLDKAALPADCPEFSIFSAWLASETLIAVCVALAGAEHLNALSWLAIPMVTLVGRFSDRAINVGKWLAVGLVLAVGLAVAPHEILSNPPVLLVPIALIVTVTMFLTQLMHSDLEYRDRAKQALIDPLTKLLSRAALENRLEELKQQSAVNGGPVAVVVADADKFKEVNGAYGHTGGDAVLRELARRLRGGPRAYDSIYRLGGDEFVLLLPGATAVEAEEVAVKLCHSVRQKPCAGVRTTVSCGVAASRPDSPFDYEETFRRADLALLAAKAAGGDCFRVAPDYPPRAFPPPPGAEDRAPSVLG